jgi:two-component system, response regulator PdtaR
MGLDTEDARAAVLVVDDEPMIRSLAVKILLGAGYKVFEACCSAEALVVLDGLADVHAVLTDIEMPGAMDGLALAATIHGRWPDIAILVTSGRCRPQEHELPEGAEFLSKPYKASAMIAHLQRLMADRITNSAASGAIPIRTIDKQLKAPD